MNIGPKYLYPISSIQLKDIKIFASILSIEEVNIGFLPYDAPKIDVDKCLK